MYILENKNIYFKYFIKKTYNAGLKLEGWEVKSIKLKKNIQIKNSLIIIKNNEFYLKNSFIPLYNKNIQSKSDRDRKLLLNKNEINEINKELLYKKKMKLLPVSIFIKNFFIKIKIAITLKKEIFYKKNEKKMSNTEY